MKTSTAKKSAARDVPGTVRVSPEGHWAIRTTDADEAPWYIAERGTTERYWATHDEVQEWQVRGR